MTSTDNLSLNQSAMFEEIRKHLPMERQITQNIVECKDDLLFVWNTQEFCLLVMDWRSFQLKNTAPLKYQTLIPSVPQDFTVDRLVVSIGGSLIALGGPRGVAVLELPRRCGKNGQYMNGKEKITCRAHNLDTQLFNNNLHLELRQLRWHPGSHADSHLLVLLSDNTLRLYENATLRYVWPVGPVPLRNDVTKTGNISSVVDLGENTVDFDFTPAVKTGLMLNTAVTDSIDQNLSMNLSNLSLSAKNAVSTLPKQVLTVPKYDWPIVLLRENGNIYVLVGGLNTLRPRLQGPLTIAPQTGNNYGIDSCAIMCIQSYPPTLVIAESNGTLHHALFLKNDIPENSYNEVDANLNIQPSQWSIHVIESVILELGLVREIDTEYKYQCAIHLKKDCINELRYFAYHKTGLHAIAINFIDEMQRYFEAEVSADISIAFSDADVEYLLCTKVDNNNFTNAILGFVVLQMPSNIVLLLSSGQVISLKLLITPKLLMLNDEKDNNDKELKNPEIKNKLNEVLEPSFVNHISNILKRNVRQPILSTDKSAEPTPVELYELMRQSMEVLRTEYIQRFELAHIEIAKRVKLINLRKEQESEEIEALLLERDNIRDKAHRLAERFEEVTEAQDSIMKKCQTLIRQCYTVLPSNTAANNEFVSQVKRINEQVKVLQESTRKVKETYNNQYNNYTQNANNRTEQKIIIPESKLEPVREVIFELTQEVANQINEVKTVATKVESLREHILG